jgi:hypothetical protein
VRKIIKWLLTWRLLLFIPVILAGMYLPFREGSLFTRLQGFGPWTNFDGVHYINIASRGYIDEGRFLPLFPILIRIVAIPLYLVVGGGSSIQAIFWAGILVSSVATVLALYFTAKLLHIDYKSKTVETAVFLLLVSPVAFFFACVYSEGLFFLFSVLSLFFARKKQWMLSTLSAMFLSITRLTGVLIILPLLWEYYELEIRENKIISFYKNINKFFNINDTQFKKYLNLAWFALIPVLLILYSYFNYLKWGDFIYFIHAHADLGNNREVSGIVFPLVILYRYIKIFISVSFSQYEFWIAALEFGALIYAGWSLFLSWKEKIRPSYLIYALGILALPLFSGTLSGFPRYILPIFPFFLAQSLWFEKNRKTKFGKIFFILFVITSIILQATLLALFARGYYVS